MFQTHWAAAAANRALNGKRDIYAIIVCVVVDIPFEMGRKLLQRPNDKFIIHERGWVENPRSLCVLVTHKNSFDCLTPFSLILPCKSNRKKNELRNNEANS